MPIGARYRNSFLCLCQQRVTRYQNRCYNLATVLELNYDACMSFYLLSYHNSLLLSKWRAKQRCFS